MITEQEATMIKDLATIVGQNTEIILTNYTAWHFTNSLGWVLFGLLVLMSVKRIKFSEHSEVAGWGQWLIKGAVVLIAASFIFNNLPDVINPKARAIHNLIVDVRSK